MADRWLEDLSGAMASVWVPDRVEQRTASSSVANKFTRSDRSAGWFQFNKFGHLHAVVRTLLLGSRKSGGSRTFSHLDRCLGVRRRYLPLKETCMKTVLILAATVLLIGSSSASFAQSKGASGLTPHTQMQNSPTPTSRGASEFTPGDRKNDMTTGSAKGASEYSPGDRMNDARNKPGKK